MMTTETPEQIMGEPSKGLDNLYAVIGDCGEFLNSDEKRQIIEFLLVASNWAKRNGSSAIAQVFENFAESEYFELESFERCAGLVSDYEGFYAAFNFPLSEKECWAAIGEIAQRELIEMAGRA